MRQRKAMKTTLPNTMGDYTAYFQQQCSKINAFKFEITEKYFFMGEF
jgi:hypothetical protein